MISKIRPSPARNADKERWQETSLRHRLLTGKWDQDLRDALSSWINQSVLDRLTHLDMSRNPFLSINRQLNVLYDSAPEVQVDAEPEDLDKIITPYLWPIRQDAHLKTLGLQECLVRLDFRREGRADSVMKDNQISYRVVAPDSVVAHADPDFPDRPVRIEECRLRYPQKDDPVWTWEIWDVSDPDNPIFKIVMEGDKGERIDVTEEYMGTEEYPYFDREGNPVLPYVLYHKELGNKLWSNYHGKEIVSGTLTSAILQIWWIHGVRDGAHPQRIGIDIEVPSAVPTDGGGSHIPLDPTSLLVVNSTNNSSGTVTTLAPAMDAGSMLSAIESYVKGLAIQAGISPADFELSSSKSGYAISLSREGLRKAQNRQVPAARTGDMQLLIKAAKIANVSMGTDLPEDPEDYSIKYAEISKSKEEIKAELEKINLLQKNGWASPVDSIMALRPELSREQALERIMEIEREKAMVERVKQDIKSMPLTESDDPEESNEEPELIFEDNPYSVVRMRDKYRVVKSETGMIAKNDSGSAVDGGGHDRKEDAIRQLIALEASE